MIVAFALQHAPSAAACIGPSEPSAFIDAVRPAQPRWPASNGWQVAVEFDGSYTVGMCNGGGDVLYEWDFESVRVGFAHASPRVDWITLGEGQRHTGRTTYVSEANGETASFQISLIVTDHGGRSNVATAQIQIVRNQPPAVTSFTTSAQGTVKYRGDPVSFTLTASDPDAEQSIGYWIRGQRFDPPPRDDPAYWDEANGGSPTFCCLVFNTVGSRTAWGYGQDSSGDSSSMTSVGYVIDNRAPETPTCSTSPADPIPDEGVTVSGSSTDPEGDPLTWAWNWGVGEPADASTASTSSHAYAAPGAYTIRADVRDLPPAVDWDFAPGWSRSSSNPACATTQVAPLNTPTDDYPDADDGQWRDNAIGQVRLTIPSTGNDCIVWTEDFNDPRQPWYGWTPSGGGFAGTPEGRWFITYAGKKCNRDTYENTYHAVDVKRDLTPPTATFNGPASASPALPQWRNTNPLLDVDFSDAKAGIDVSGLRTAEYSLGTAAGAIDLKGWTPVGAGQPFPVETRVQYVTDWSVDATALRQGDNFVNVRAQDHVGATHLRTFNGIARIFYDTIVPSKANPIVTSGASQNANGWFNARLDLGVDSADATSGIAQECFLVNGGAPSSCSADASLLNLADGTTSIAGRATDYAGNVLTSPATTYRLDRNLPLITNNNLAGFDTTWRNANPALNIDFSDDRSGLWNLEYSICSQAIGCTDRKAWTLITPAIGTDGTLTFATDWQVDAGALAQGFNYINVRATDRAGNLLARNALAVIKWDTTGPSITNNLPAAFSTTWRNTNPSLDVDFLDGASLKSIQYSLGSTAGATDRKPWTDIVAPFAEGTTAYTTDWSIDPAPLRQGDNFLNVRATDYFGQLTTSNALLTIKWDTLPPPSSTVVLESGTPNVNGWHGTSPTLRVDSADDQSAGAGTSSGIVQECFATSASGPWTDCGAQATKAPADSTNTWFGRSTDQAGNAFTGPGLGVIKVDLTPPTLANNNPSGFDTTWRRSNPLLDVDFADPAVNTVRSGLWNLDYSLCATTTGCQTLKPWTPIAPAFSTDGTSGYTLDWSIDSTAFQQGTNYVNARATDRAGKVGIVNAIAAIRWDTVNPSKATTRITSGGTPNANGWYTGSTDIDADTADATSGIAQECLRIDGGAWQRCATAAVWATIPEGSHAYEARADDAAGNTLTGSPLNVKVDVTVPTIANNNPAGFDVTWRSTNPPLDIDFADAASGLWIIEYSLGSAAGLTDYKPWTNIVAPFASDGTTSFNAAWSVDAPSLRQGTNVLNVRATDRAGKQALLNGAATIRWDTLPPTQATALVSNGATPNANNWYQTQVDLRIDSTEDTSQGAGKFSGISQECIATSTNGPWTDCASQWSRTNWNAGQSDRYPRAQDAAGNSRIGPLLRINRDPTLPNVGPLTLDDATTDAPSNTDATKWHNEANGRISIPLSDALAGLETYWWKLDAPVAPATDPPSVQYTLSGSDPASGPSSKSELVSFAQIPDGSHTVFAAARDAAGNIASANLAVRLDRAPPTLSNPAPSAAERPGVPTPITLRVDAADANAGLDLATHRFHYALNRAAPLQTASPASPVGFQQSTQTPIQPTADDDWLFWDYQASDHAHGPNTATLPLQRVELDTHSSTPGQASIGVVAYNRGPPAGAPVSASTQDLAACNQAGTLTGAGDGGGLTCIADDNCASVDLPCNAQNDANLERLLLRMPAGANADPTSTVGGIVVTADRGGAAATDTAYDVTLLAECSTTYGATWQPCTNQPAGGAVDANAAAPGVQFQLVVPGGPATPDTKESVPFSYTFDEKTNGEYTTHWRLRASTLERRTITEVDAELEEMRLSRLLRAYPYVVRVSAGATAPADGLPTTVEFNRIGPGATCMGTGRWAVGLDDYNSLIKTPTTPIPVGGKTATFALAGPAAARIGDHAYFGVSCTGDPSGVTAEAGDGRSARKATQPIRETILSLVVTDVDVTNTPRPDPKAFVFGNRNPDVASIASTNYLRIDIQGTAQQIQFAIPRDVVYDGGTAGPSYRGPETVSLRNGNLRLELLEDSSPSNLADARPSEDTSNGATQASGPAGSIPFASTPAGFTGTYWLRATILDVGQGANQIQRDGTYTFTNPNDRWTVSVAA